MKLINKIFGNTEMTWKRVIIFSLICGVVPGLLMIPDFLDGTSLQMPGATHEFWVLAALFIIMNCKKPREAGVKTFVFFLISQPIIYLVQVPFSWRGWDLFSYYPYWALITVLTFPGAMLAWFVKKQKWYSVAILSVANAIVGMIFTSMLSQMLSTFPKLLLTEVFCISEIILFTLMSFEDKKKRIASFIIAGAVIAGVAIYLYSPVFESTVSTGTSPEGPAPYELIEAESDLFQADINDFVLRITYKTSDIKENGAAGISYMDADGVIHEVTVVYGDGKCSFEEASQEE